MCRRFRSAPEPQSVRQLVRSDEDPRSLMSSCRALIASNTTGAPPSAANPPILRRLALIQPISGLYQRQTPEAAEDRSTVQPCIPCPCSSTCTNPIGSGEPASSASAFLDVHFPWRKRRYTGGSCSHSNRERRFRDLRLRSPGRRWP